MRKKFHGYYHPDETYFKNLWDNSIFVFDSSVLLDLYRYSQGTSNEIIKTIEKISSRIWIPYQVGLEFHRNRLDVINDQRNAYEKLKENLENQKKGLSDKLKTNKHPFLENANEFIEKIEKLFASISSQLDKEKEKNLEYFNKNVILNKITKLFDNKVGEKYSDDNLKNLYSEGKRRYELKIPPGYEDKGKKDELQFGDLVVWYQIIDKAQELKKPIILVTSEQKEDWWYKINNKTIGPRPELIQEINEKANVNFYMYHIELFLEYSKEHFKTEIKKETIDEIKTLRKNMESKLKIENDKLRELLQYTKVPDSSNITWNDMFKNSILSNKLELSNIFDSLALKVPQNIPNSSFWNDITKSVYDTPNILTIKGLENSTESKQIFNDDKKIVNKNSTELYDKGKSDPNDKSTNSSDESNKTSDKK